MISKNNVVETIETFDKLGFIIQPEKSVLNPQKQIKFLGFIINSNTMSVTLTDEKIGNITMKLEYLLMEPSPTIREVARVIGLIVSSFPAVQYGQCHYRAIENDKIYAIKISRGNF